MGHLDGAGLPVQRHDGNDHVAPFVAIRLIQRLVTSNPSTAYVRRVAEVFNDNGVFVQRAIVSVRIPSGTVFIYHATERTIGIPKSPLRKNRRAGMNNSLTRARLKPVLMSGGYAQFTYSFNYWGPTGVNRDTFVFVRKIEEPDF